MAITRRDSRPPTNRSRSMNSNILRIPALLVGLFYLTSCASIVSGGSKILPIVSQPDEANIEILDVRNNMTISKAKTPFTAVLERSAGFFQAAEYRIKITKEGYLPYEAPIEANINGWYFGNIVFGGIIGILIVDPATGAMWKISEENVNVKLYPDTTEGKVSMAKEKYNGREALNHGDYDKCIEETSMGISIHPGFYQGYGERATCYRKKNDIDKALVDANKAIELKADFPFPYWERAESLIIIGENAKALSDLDKAIELKPDYANAYFTRGKLQYSLRNIEAAKADIQKAASLGNQKAKNFQF
jgi:tetratricopeptide (TPR) repeat protein